MKSLPLLALLLVSPAVLADVNELAVPAGQGQLLEPYAPYKLVGLMPDTGQILLWDENTMSYRLAKAGDDLDGWRVSGLDARDPRGVRVALQKDDLIDELELVRLPRPGSVIVFKDSRMHGAAAAVAAAPPAAAPLPAALSAAPPASAGAPAPVAIAPTVIAAPPPALRPAPPPPPAVREETYAIARRDLDRQLNDFDGLMASVAVDAAEGGGFILAKLDPRSWIATLGFREGDVVRSLAGERVSTVEDAARVYARLRTLPAFSAEIERGAMRVVLRFEVTEVRDGR